MATLERLPALRQSNPLMPQSPRSHERVLASVAGDVKALAIGDGRVEGALAERPQDTAGLCAQRPGPARRQRREVHGPADHTGGAGDLAVAAAAPEHVAAACVQRREAAAV